MNSASYITTQTANGGIGKYPLSTQTLDFIQQQVQILEQLSLIGGEKNYILVAPDGSKPGVCVINGEVLAMSATPKFSTSIKYVNVKTEKRNIMADGEEYREARTIRTASFSASSSGSESYDINTFANVSGKKLSPFPTNAALSETIRQMPNDILEKLADVLAEKLTAKTVKGLTKAQMDKLLTPMLLSCENSVALFNDCTSYSLMVSLQGSIVRQELTQRLGETYVRYYSGGSWGNWQHVTETSSHIEVKVVARNVYIRHGNLPADASIILLRKKKRSRWRSTGGSNALSKNRGKRVKRQPKTQFVHYKGIVLSKGTPGEWYVPRCIRVADEKTNRHLIGKEMPTLCETLFYFNSRGIGHIQGFKSNIVLKTTKDVARPRHTGYALVGIQIARLNAKGGKDSGGEITRLKYRVLQAHDYKNGYRLNTLHFLRTFSMGT